MREIDARRIWTFTTTGNNGETNDGGGTGTEEDRASMEKRRRMHEREKEKARGVESQGQREEHLKRSTDTITNFII